MLVWIASYPRSGNTLTVLTLHDVFGIRGMGAIWDDDLALGQLRHRLVPLREAPKWQPPPDLDGLTGEALLSALCDRPELYFVKTHRLSDATHPAPALYIVRDGRDALVSHAHLVKSRKVPRFEGMPFNRRLSTLIHPGIPGYGRWEANTMAWRRRDAPVVVVRYEELVTDPVAVVAGACKEIGVELPEPSGEMLSFESLREQKPTLFRRGITGAWRDEMPEHLHERFWKIHGSEMRSLGYH